MENLFEKYDKEYFFNERRKNFKKNLQIICKFFRENICQVSLSSLSEIYGVSVASLSAWEHGKSSNAEYIIIYYDIITDSDYRKIFLNLVFNSPGKNIVVDVFQKSIENNKYRTYSVVLNEEPCTNGEIGSINFLVKRTV